MQKIVLLVTSIFVTTTAHATCDFGKNTWELEEKFEAPRESHDFYRGETVSLSKEVRLGGLYPVEKDMIRLAMSQNDGTTEPSFADPAAQLKEFSQTDGYLTYFSHRPTGRQFVQVGHFPGDNEYGAIVEIGVDRDGTRILGLVSKIEDGEIVACRE